jgi:membrane protein
MTNASQDSRQSVGRLRGLRGKAGSGMLFHGRVWRLVFRRLGKNNAMAMAAALSFQTIFALVPIIVLVIVIGKSFGHAKQGKEWLREQLNNTGFAQIVAVSAQSAEDGGEPATAPGARADTQPTSRLGEVINVADKVVEVVERVEKRLTLGAVGPIGGALLIWTALSLLSTMEDSLNRTFGAERSRSIIRRVIVYWFVVSLAPLLIAAATFASKQAVDFLGVGRGSVLAWVVGILGAIQPLLVGVLLLTAIYVLMPNTRVRVWAALYGAAVAFPLWLAAKWAFQLYVVNVVGGDPLYGTLGLIPLFLMWLNFSWLLFLLGAELAHTAQNLGRLISAEQAERRVLGTWDLVATAVAVARQFATAGGPAGLSRLAEDLRLPPEAVSKLMDRLTGAGIMVAVDNSEEQAYVPARSLDRIRAEEILSIGVRDGEGESQPAEAIARIVARIRQAAGEGLKDRTMADLVRD